MNINSSMLSLEIFYAILIASSSKSYCGYTLFTIPNSRASDADQVPHVSDISIVFDFPIRSFNLCVSPHIEKEAIYTSGRLKLALSPAKTMSHYMATIKPPPSQNPFTAAIIGLDIQFQFSICVCRRSISAASAIVSDSSISYTLPPILNAL